MSKQTISTGSVIDDGTGDYLRKGGIKTNANFDEIYYNLGDEKNIHASGAWKVITPQADDATIQLSFGDQVIINASNTQVLVYLPRASFDDVGKTVKIRDTFKTWGDTPTTNLVIVGGFIDPQTGVPYAKNKIKGNANTVTFSDAYRDLEFIYTADEGWEYVDSMYIDRFSNSNRSIENSVEFQATAVENDKWDLNELYEYVYNVNTVEVFRKGNLLSKGVDSNGRPTLRSDYGSIPTAENPAIVVTVYDEHGVPTEIDLGVARLDGESIKLVEPAYANDTIIVKSLLENPDIYTSTYKSRSVVVKDVNTDFSEYDPQSVVELDLENLTEVTLVDLGFPVASSFNPGSLNISINGKRLINENFVTFDENPNNKLPLYDFRIERSAADLNGDGDVGDPNLGAPEDDTYELQKLIYNKIVFASTGYLKDGDVLTLEWFNNNTGASLDWEGKGGIEELVSDSFVKSNEFLTFSSRLEYSDVKNPSAQTAIIESSVYNARVADVNQFFDICYPIGTIYENAHNPHNPAQYMGMGVWEPYAKDCVTIGWSEDGVFANNPITQQPMAGGYFGSYGVTLSEDNIPHVKTDEQGLIQSSEKYATISISEGCLLDPTQATNVKYFTSDYLNVNRTNVMPEQVSTIQPSLTVYKWIRVA